MRGGEREGNVEGVVGRRGWGGQEQNGAVLCVFPSFSTQHTSATLQGNSPMAVIGCYTDHLHLSAVHLSSWKDGNLNKNIF